MSGRLVDRRGRVYVWPQEAPAAAPDASERISETPIDLNVLPVSEPATAPVARGTLCRCGCGRPLNADGVNETPADELADDRLSRLDPDDRAFVARRVFRLRTHGASYRLIAWLLDVSEAAAQELYLEHLAVAVEQLRPAITRGPV